MSQLNTQMSERTETTEDEIERMARERAEIERELEERESELAKIGEFSYARCTEFQRDDHEMRGRTIEKLQFVFQYPDRTTKSRWFDFKDEPKSLNKFMNAHGADSLTDMIGAKHACVRTNTGWQLLDRQSVRPWAYYQHVSQDGSLTSIHWPSFMLFLLAFPIGGVITGMLALQPPIVSVAITALIASVVFFYTMAKGGYYG